MNKTLKYHPGHIEPILKNGVAVDVRLFDDKNLSVGDTIDLLNAKTGEKFAMGTITRIKETTFEWYAERGADVPAIYEDYRERYGRDIKPTDAAKIVRIDLIKTIAVFNDENATDEEVKNFRHRRAVRGIIFDINDNVALLHARERGYYGLPGGGVNGEETYEQGIIRECKEETGCEVEIVRYIGTIIEYRKGSNLVNESRGYIVRVIGEKESPILVGDESEEEKNSIIVWVPLLEAIHLMESIPHQTELYSQYCIDRDLTFLKGSIK